MLAALLAAACFAPRSIAATTCVSQAQLSPANRAPHCAASRPQLSLHKQAPSLHVSRSRACASLNIAARRASCAASFARVRFFASLMSTAPCSRGAFFAPGFCLLLRAPEVRGGRSAERTSGACEAPVRRVSDTPGAGEAPRVPRRGTPASRRSTVAILGRACRFPSPALRPDRSATPRSPGGVVPRGRGAEPPRQAVTSRRRGTPLLAPPSGLSLEDTPHERGCESLPLSAFCSQAQNVLEGRLNKKSA